VALGLLSEAGDVGGAHPVVVVKAVATTMVCLVERCRVRLRFFNENIVHHWVFLTLEAGNW
jgi:hypothetical protein